MSRTFLYARVSTSGQFTENQTQEVKAAGFDVQASRVVEETISGSIAASERPGFKKLLDRMEGGDVLIVTKLDRLGRNAMDVRQTVESLATAGIRVHCLALGGVDLTSPAGKMTMQVLGAVAEFERDLLIERTQQGLMRAKAEGKKLGRPEATTTTTAVQRLKARDMTQAQVAAELGLGIATIKRHWNKD
jgi:putative DNA-invertase from lambdoid prophage Rac